MREVICPACGALIEAESDADLVEYARTHTRDAHAYDIPEEHVLKAAYDADAPPLTTDCDPDGAG